MSGVIIISGPIGAGKSTVARELVPRLPEPVACIEGDKFWSFIGKSGSHDVRENFTIIMRAMMAATVPFTRSGYDVVVDFSVPPYFLGVARKILKEIPLDYVVLRPSEAVCRARAAARPEGTIADYSKYSEFYALFEVPPAHRINNENTDAAATAAQILAGLKDGRFRIA